MKRSGIEFFDYFIFKCIVGECGIQSDFFSRKVVEYFELMGVGLRLGVDFFVLVF